MIKISMRYPYAADGRFDQADIPNDTNIEPIRQVSLVRDARPPTDD